VPELDPYLRIDVSETDDAVTLRIAGEVDIANWLQLRHAFDRVLARRPPPARICADLAAVTFLDSNGLAALLTTRSHAEDAGCRFRVTAVSAPLQRLFDIAGLTTLLMQD
jgi:anti-anti-sigma factor